MSAAFTSKKLMVHAFTVFTRMHASCAYMLARGRSKERVFMCLPSGNRNKSAPAPGVFFNGPCLFGCSLPNISSPVMSKPASGSLAHVVNTLWKQYNISASSKVKVVDVYGAFCIATAAVLHGYMSVLGSFPFNSYLAALFTCIGGGVLAGCLRMQLDTTNKEFRALAPERAYADFILAHLVLIFIAWNYIG